jgi:uncharacterized protein YlxP (DUF503 family)
VFVGMAQISVVIGHSHSLKDKRMVVRRIKDRVRERLGVTVAEVGDSELWQRADFGVAVPSGSHGKAVELVDDVVREIERAIASTGNGEVVAVHKDVAKLEGIPA